MAQNSFIETITTGTFEVSKARYDYLLDIETKYNQLFRYLFDNENYKSGMSDKDIENLLYTIDQKLATKIHKENMQKEDK